MLKKLTLKNYFDLAILEAQKSFDQDQVPVGAVLVHQDQIIAQFHNGPTPLDHAEFLCLNAGYAALGRKLQEAVLYVTMEPCAMCHAAISLCNLSAVYFGAYSHKSILNPNIPFYGGFYEKECEVLLKDFFKSKR